MWGENASEAFFECKTWKYFLTLGDGDYQDARGDKWCAVYYGCVLAQLNTDCAGIFLATCHTLSRPLRDMRARLTRHALLAGPLQGSLLFRAAATETVVPGLDEMACNIELLEALLEGDGDGDTLSVRALSKRRSPYTRHCNTPLPSLALSAPIL